MENYEFCVLGYNQSSHDTFLWQKSISMFYVANNVKLTHYGFKLCELIDYKYDVPGNNRTELFLNSIDRFLEIELTTLIEYANDRKDILAHNRSLFVNLPYSELNGIF